MEAGSRGGLGVGAGAVGLVREHPGVSEWLSPKHLGHVTSKYRLVNMGFRMQK